MDQVPAPHAARMSMPPAIARSFWKWSSSFRMPNFVWNRTAVATQNTPSAAAANRAPKPIARAVPAAICRAMAGKGERGGDAEPRHRAERGVEAAGESQAFVDEQPREH